MFERQSSDNSTFTVSTNGGNSSKEFQPHPGCSCSNSKKRVRFAPTERNEYYEDEARCQEELDLTWYSSEEFCSFRSDSLDLVREAQEIISGTVDDEEVPTTESKNKKRAKSKKKSKEMKEFGKTLKILFKATCNVTKVKTNVKKELFDKEVLKHLGKLYASHTELIGLEVYLVKEFQRGSRIRRDALHQAASDVQDEFSQGKWTQDQFEEELQESCNYFSQALILMGQTLALGQQMADEKKKRKCRRRRKSSSS